MIEAVEINIDGLGACELRPPSVADVGPFQDEMQSDLNSFIRKAVEVSLYQGGKLVDDALAWIPFYQLPEITEKMTGLLFSSVETEPDKNGESGND